MPDFVKYYWAAQLRRIPAWSSLYAYSRWTEIEELWIAPIHPNSFLWSSPCVQAPTPLLGPMSLTRQVWKTCSRKFGLCSQSSAVTSFLLHPEFPESLTGTFRPWLFRFVDVVDYRTRKIHTFDSLRSMFSLPRDSLFIYSAMLIHAAVSILYNSLPTHVVEEDL